MRIDGRWKGGKALAAKMTPEQRAERARHAAQSRWAKYDPSAPRKVRKVSSFTKHINHIRDLLEYIGEDPTRGGLIETPERFIKSLAEQTSGYHVDPLSVLKTFEDGAETYEGIVLETNIPVYSLCEHHIAPFFGIAHVGYIPDGKVVGLSKIPRLIEVYSRRLQVQERLTAQIAQTLKDGLEAKAVGVVMRCRHMCMESRGARVHGAITTTSSMLGGFRSDAAARAEFMSMVEQSHNGVTI